MGERTRVLKHPGVLLVAEARRVVGLVGVSGALSSQSALRFEDLVGRFVEFCVAGHGLGSLGEVTPSIAGGFVAAGTRAGRPSVATQHVRRSSLRLLFRYARQLGLVELDPTIDLRLPPRSNVRCRPLTGDEVGVCRSFALWSLTNTRRPAAWALAEATARTAELPHISVADVELEQGRVWIHGSSRTEPRWGAFSEWGVVQVARRVADLRERGADESTLLVYEGAGSVGSGQASSCLAISDTLIAAGFAGERDVRPLSVAAWAGRCVFAASGRIEVAALVLGVRSLDRAARLIGWDWHEPEEPS